MRDLALFTFVACMLPFVLKNPFIGVALFTWFSIMNPHRLTYGAAYDFPFDAVIVAVTLISLLISKQKKQFPFNAVTITLLLFVLWMSVTTLFALEPARAYKEWDRVIKTMLLSGVMMLTIRTKNEIQICVAILALSIGFYGFKGGLFTIVNGGTNHVFGPEGSYISDNNALALAMVTALPLIWYLSMAFRQALARFAALSLFILTGLSVVGSYSRGAMVSAAVMLLFLLFKSKRKWSTALALLILIPIALSVMPETWFERMHTLDNYAHDMSAIGRINAWNFAINVANSHFFGGGLDCFSHQQFIIYAPDPYNHHAAHSIYFQVLGEHGYIGLALFLLFLLFAWRTGSRIIAKCKDHRELDWAANLGAMCQVSIIGFMTGGAFLTMAYYDLFYDIVAVLVVLEKYLDNALFAVSEPTSATASTRENRP